jgi:UDP-apiose/xylose synthase
LTDTATPTVCVLGAGGFIGSHLLERLLADGRFRVLGVDREDRKVGPLLGRPGLDFRRFDLAEGERLREAVDASDAVVNLASLCNPSLYNTRTLETVESNFMDALPTVRACREAGVHLVHVSTCEVYGRTLAGYAPEGSPFREDPAHWVLGEESPMVLGPLHRERWCYAAAKALLERVIQAEGRENGLRWTIIRPFNFVGPRMDFIPGVDGEGLPRVWACFLEALLKGRPLPLVDGGRARRTFCAVEDAVDATVRILERRGAVGGRVFNIGNPANECSIADLAGRVVAAWEEATGRCWEHGTRDVPALEFYGEGYEDSDRRVPDIGPARELLGWEPRTPLDSIVRGVLDAFLRDYGGGSA